MNNNELIDNNNLFIKTEMIAKNIILLEETIFKISTLINNLEDENLWQSTAATSIKEKYLKEQKNYEKLCILLKKYITRLTEVNTISKNNQIILNNLIEEMENKISWDI